jgi:hypothetical protein
LELAPVASCPAELRILPAAAGIPAGKARKRARQAAPASGRDLIGALPDKNPPPRSLLPPRAAGGADLRARSALATPLEVHHLPAHRRRRWRGAGVLRGGLGVCGQPLAPPWKLASGDI